MRLTVCASGLWVGRDSVWEQEKLEARKLLENAAESQNPLHALLARSLFGRVCALNNFTYFNGGTLYIKPCLS